MNAELQASWDKHDWTLQDASVTQIIVDVASVRIISWHTQGSADFRLGCPFRYLEADGTDHVVDPEHPEQVAPLLSLISSFLIQVIVVRSGSLTLKFGDGSLVQIDPHPRFEAWEARGGGACEDLNYLCNIGGGSPWG